MDFNNEKEVLEATLYFIEKEETDVMSYYIQNDEVRNYVVNEVRKRGYQVINAVSKKHIYVDLKQ